jgi:hypothetical protein
MKRAQVRALVKRLAVAWDFRYAALTKSYVGICRGTNVSMTEYDAIVSLEFIAPGAILDEQFDLKFSGFRRFRELGLNPEILRGVTLANGWCRDRVIIRFDVGQLADVGVERLEKIPWAVASDLIRFGASASFTCVQCEAEPATKTMLVNYGLTNYCDSCCKQVEVQTVGGKFLFDPQVKWGAALAVLVVSCLLLGGVWGYVQSPERMAVGVSYFFVFTPIVGGFLVSRAVHRAAGQADALLRLLIVLGSFLAVVGGNICRTQALLARTQATITWWETAPAYFNHVLLRDFQTEWYFVYAAPLGAWLTNRWMKSQQVIRIS